MEEVAFDVELDRLLSEYTARGGVFDFVCLRSVSDGPVEALHRAAALAGMAAIDRKLERWALAHTSPQLPLSAFYRVTWDASCLVGAQVSFETFWGNDDVASKPLGSGAWSLPERDGYKTAFFQPPYPLRGDWSELEHIFTRINALIFGPDPRACEIYSWGTDWSNYFDAGKEWWGTFFWTLRLPDSDVFTVIGASTTD